MRFLLALAATAISGLLYALAFPPISWKPLAWVALAPFFLALRGVGPRAALFLAWFWAVFASSLVADALPRAVETYFFQPRLQSLLFAVLVWTLTGSVYYMVFAPVYRAMARRPTAALPLLAAAAWAALELARGRLLSGSSLFVGNPWALIAYSQVGSDALVQIAAVTGVYGISFCIVAVNAAVAEIGREIWVNRRLSRKLLATGVVALLPTAAALLYGQLALRSASAEDGASEVPVALVQGNINMGSRWRSDFYGRNLDTHMQLTWEALKDGRPRIAFWPEGALTFFLEEEPLYQRSIERLLSAADLELVVGGPSIEDAEAKHLVYFNSIFLLDPRAKIRGRYDKRHLLPFAEYFPLPQVDFLRRRFERVRFFKRGEPSPPLATRAGAAGVLVCNEAMYPEVARARVLEGAEYLLSPSNDTWIQDEVWAHRMFDLVSLRAVEQRRYLVRASTSGPSAIVDPWGRVQQRSRPFERGVLVGSIRPRNSVSVYGRVGDAFILVCVASVIAALVLPRVRAWAAGP